MLTLWVVRTISKTTFFTIFSFQKKYAHLFRIIEFIFFYILEDNGRLCSTRGWNADFKYHRYALCCL